MCLQIFACAIRLGNILCLGAGINSSHQLVQGPVFPRGDFIPCVGFGYCYDIFLFIKVDVFVQRFIDMYFIFSIVHKYWLHFQWLCF